jgi:hypothetical protein
MALPEIGTLYTPFEPGNLPPTYTQPGGAGTLVYPQQPMGERSAQYAAGCGHWFNCWTILEAYDDVKEVQAAIIACPLCFYVQQIIEPYEEYLNYIRHPIVVA